MFEFNQWAKIKLLCRLGKSAEDTLVSISVLYGINALRNLLCTTCNIDFKMVKNHDKTIKNSPTHDKNVTKFHIIKSQNKSDNKISISDRVVQSILLKDVSMPHIPKENQMEIENIVAAVFFE
jgi:hypothetical protein